jgi:hypothetical protein
MPVTTKVTIIDVDLGANVEDIIADDIRDLTGAARVELDQAIEIAKASQRLKQERSEATKAAANKLTSVMDQAYDALVAADAIGIAVTNIMGLVAGAVPNSSAFTLRMKHILAAKGNPFILERIKHNGTPHYRFMPYNQQPIVDGLPC